MAVRFCHSRTGCYQGVGFDPQLKCSDVRWTLYRDCPRLAPTARPSGIPSAFTLLELLFVLAVLAMLSSVALPRVERMLAKGEHRAAADSLHAALSQLRLQAIQTGRTHSFRFVPGSGIFELRAEGVDEVGQMDFTAADNLTDGTLDESLGDNGPDGSQNSGRESSSLADWAGADTLTEPLEDSGEFSIGSASDEGMMQGDQVERRQLSEQLWLVSSLEEEPTQAGELANEGYGGRDQAGGPGEPLMVESLDVSMTDDSTADQWSAPISFFPDGRASDARLFVIAPSGYTIVLTVVGISGKVRVSNRRRLPAGASELDLSASTAKDSTIGSERIDGR